MGRETRKILDVLIVGGGLAGLCSAIHLSKSGKNVTLIEKGKYPRHKVCGEYVSNEVLPYLRVLGIDPFEAGAVKIDTLDFALPNGASIHARLPLGGFSISRYALDRMLMEKALEEGARFIQDTVTDIGFGGELFEVKTRNGLVLKAEFVIGAYGKRSLLDKKLERRFMQQPASYVAVKAHYSGSYPKHQVGLYNFEGGYCGVSNVEGGKLNLCYIADTRHFAKYRNPEKFQEQVLFKNKELEAVFVNSILEFDKPLSISNISFEPKVLVEDHILMAGDSAGMIHPLCGNGMGMAIGAAEIASNTILSYFNGEIQTRGQVEKIYEKNWKRRFQKRLIVGRTLAALLRNYRVSYLMLPLLRRVPFLLNGLIRSTHGKPSMA